MTLNHLKISKTAINYIRKIEITELQRETEEYSVPVKITGFNTESTWKEYICQLKIQIIRDNNKV